MNLSNICNLDEIKAEVLRCISTELDCIHNLDTKDLSVKGLTLKRQTYVAQETISNLDLPEMRSWSGSTQTIKESDLSKAGIPKDTVFITALEVAKLAEVILESNYAKRLGAKRVGDVAFSFDQNEYMCVKVEKVSETVRNKIVMALIRNEVKAALKEKSEFAKFKELKAKYEPDN